ncbi:MAG: EAL domain-containing protein [Leptolyngbya sp. SIO1E4]|nr:EAL domain-containing protein [Leptolyngbya sp. SIO1E4]
MRKLLVIEKEGAQRQSHLAILTQEGYETIVTDSLTSALDLARQQPPDLILCGLDLTGGDNHELLQQLQNKQDLLAIPVVLLTHTRDIDRWRQSVVLGADDCLVAPFTEKDLVEAISGRLRKQDALTNRYNTLMRHTAERLNRLAHYDSLTDLPNYQLLRQRLMQAMQRAAIGQQRVALLSLSLDRLRQVNNTLGYPAGDTLLRATARRLTGSLPRSTAVARLTGNQFAIVVPAPPDQATIAAIAEDIFDSLSRSFSLPGQEVFVTTSIGIAIFPDDTDDLSTLLRQADAALDWAKLQKSNSYRFYRPDMPVVSGDELQLETWLRYALERQEFEIYYQPKHSLQTNRIEGAEALIRWRHPEHGYISPARFVPLAEETGLIVPIGDWVLRTVCAQVARWLHDGQRPISVAVNLSSVQLNQSNLCQILDDILKETHLPPDHLELEVTETALMQDVETALTLLHRLKELGVRLAIDDFGTGYASLGYLRQLPIDILKIDTCFVRGIDQDTKNQIIIKRVIEMAHDLNLKVVAEGVEMQSEMELLRGYHCDLIQGYWVGLPMVAAELAQKI